MSLRVCSVTSLAVVGTERSSDVCGCSWTGAFPKQAAVTTRKEARARGMGTVRARSARSGTGRQEKSFREVGCTRSERERGRK